ncbi:hypothetical protein SBA4_1280013 [Candidatus Sulfopaludibacter sp. SbA4]|nr:hypothetical protein SBA4_1280013 [Candidatus Sulfopaludibacter sp. SbA4]
MIRAIDKKTGTVIYEMALPRSSPAGSTLWPQPAQEGRRPNW